MSHLLDELLAQAANGSPATVAFSAEDVAVVLFASGFLDVRENWLDKIEFPLDEVTDADWDTIEKLVGNVYEAIMNPLIGLILPIVTTYVPTNCLLCDGATYDRVDFPILYGVLDAVFIVDADTFVVPDLRSRVVVGAGEGSGLTDYPVGESGGVETVTLSASQMPSHVHGLFETTSLAVEPGEAPVLIPFIAALRSTDSAGGDGPHDNIQPFTALNYVVIAQ